MDSYIHLPSIPSFPIALVTTRDPELLCDFSDNLLRLLPCSSFRLNNPTNNSSLLSGIRSSPVDHMSHKILQMQFDLPMILCSLVLPKVLSACIMVKSICLAIFINILCPCHPKPIDSLCCDCSQSSVKP